MKLPTIQGIIRRRILANFRIDPVIMQKQIPDRFRPKLQDGFAVAGICLIRLEHIRPKLLPAIVGLNSENAAHRVAVLWEEKEQPKEGVFISRRDTDSRIAHLAGGRIFPGEHNEANFDVVDTGSEIKFSMNSNDFGKIGYGGACPPSGTHRYFFKFYALDTELPLQPGATKNDVEKAMAGHIVGQTQLMGTYSRR